MQKRRIREALRAKRAERKVIAKAPAAQAQTSQQETPDHPILTLQHQLGNIRVARLIASHGIQRDWNIPPFALGGNRGTPRDMVEDNWSRLASPAAGPAQPLPIVIDMGPVPPMPPEPETHSSDFDCRSQNCHRPNQTMQFDAWSMDRQLKWQTLTSDVAQVTDVFGQIVPLITKFNDATKNHDLSEVYGIEVTGHADMATQAEAKVVGGLPGKPGTTVGKLFGSGTSLNTRDIKGNIESLSKGSDVNSPFMEKMNAVKTAELEVEAASKAVAAANLTAGSTSHAVKAAGFLIEEDKLGAEKKEAEGKLAELKERAETLKKYIGFALKAVTFVAGLALAPEVAVPASIAGAAGDSGEKSSDEGKEAKKGGLPEGLGEKGAWVAQKAIDFWYAGDVASLGAKIATLSTEMEAAHKGYLNENEMMAALAHAAALTAVSEKMLALKAAISKRRGAYMALAGATAKASGGTSPQNQKLQGIISAIPACEAVVAATSNIVDLIHEPPYTRESGIALGMAANSTQNINILGALRFVDTLGILRGYRIDFRAKNRLWEERLKSANEVMTRLGKNRA